MSEESWERLEHGWQEGVIQLGHSLVVLETDEGPGAGLDFKAEDALPPQVIYPYKLDPMSQRM